MKSPIIAIVGMCGSGKSTATAIIRELYDVDHIYFGGIVLTEMDNRGLEHNAENERYVRGKLREAGLDVLAKKVIKQIEVDYKNSDKIIVLDGLYSMAEYKTLQREFHDRMYVIAIHADKRIRYKRLEVRVDRSLTKEEVDTRDLSEIDNLEKGGPIAIADYHIVNNGDEKSLKLDLEKCLSKILE